MADKTPIQIQGPGTASDFSVVHASQDNPPDSGANFLSFRHLELDISRLRSAINNYVNTKDYFPGDIVRHENTMWRAHASGPLSGDFDKSQWDVVSPTLEIYSEDRAYGLGALIIGSEDQTPGLDGVQLRSLSLQSAGAFDRTQWEISDGVAVKMVQHIFSEADFPAVSSVSLNGASAIDVHVLEDGISYLISDSLTITDPLFIPINASVELFEIGQGVTTLSIPDGGIITQPLTSGCTVDNDGAGTLTITTDVNHNLINGDVVNVKAELTLGAPYNLFGETISNVTANTFDITGQPGGPSGTVGRWDRGAARVEINNLTLKPSGTNSSAAIDVVMAQATPTDADLTFFRMVNCNLENFVVANKITNGSDVLISRILIEQRAPFELSNCQVLIIEQIIGIHEDAIDLFTITGNATNFVNSTDIIVNIRSGSTHMFAIPQLNVTLPDTIVDADIEFHIHDSKDSSGGKTTLFSPDNDGLDQTAVNFFVHDNGDQRDSLTFADVRMDTSVADGEFSPDGVLGSNVNIDDDVNSVKLWSFASQQRFTLLETSSGEIEYEGIKDVELLINYSASIRIEGSNTQHQKYFISAYHAEPSMAFTEITNARIFGTQIDETIFATGTVTISQPVAVGKIVTIDGEAYTTVSGAAAAFQFDISSNNSTTIAGNLASTINTDGNGNYTALAAGVVVTITSTLLPGSDGNSIDLASDDASMVTSGAFLTGGEDSGIVTISGSVLVDMETGDKLKLQAGNLTSNNISDLFFVSAASMAIHELE